MIIVSLLFPDDLVETRHAFKTTIEAYEAIKVPEVWVYDSGKLNIYIFKNGKYFQSDTSPIFPNIPLTKIIPDVIARSWQVGTVQALEELETKINL